MNEFQLIQNFFQRANQDAMLGIGDDAAILRPSPAHELVVSSDMLVVGHHFFADVDPYALGHKALAVNLSDMAAMAAKPRWALLSIALPNNDEAWLNKFSAGFFALANQHQVSLIGGDTTCGALTISICIIGEALPGKALRRSGAQEHDDIWLSGKIGLASLALQHKLGDIKLPPDLLATCLARLDYPTPRVELAQALQNYANSCIDVSDGLLADLEHILDQSKLGASLYIDKIPTHAWLKERQVSLIDNLLAGGDDYELLFSANKKQRANIEDISLQHNIQLTRIGIIESQVQLRVIDKQGNQLAIQKKGFDHFAPS